MTFSLNCDHPSLPCASDPNIGLGGAWGWFALDPAPGYVENGQVTFCGHGGGAFHMSVNGTWSPISSSTPVGPFVDPNGNYLYFGPQAGLPPFPATYGHYAVSLEGASGEITIAP